MKVFASDLDQTLIYSNKWIDGKEDIVKCIEIFEEKPLSFMLLDEIKKLIEIDKKYNFIPVTTRTKVQYERIKLPVNPKYAVVANGATILIDGEIDKTWESIITVGLEKSMSTHDMKGKLEELLNLDGVEKLRDADGLFLYMITDVEKFDNSILRDYRNFVESGLWSIHDQGKKVYFVPKIITKGAALNYLKEMNSYDYIVSAGDSGLDESMKIASDHFIAPGHSKFEASYKCDSKGIDCGLEIVKRAMLYLDDAK
ncbi:MAG: HAD family hydrolase [Acidaminobacteraceae bacterium]